MDSISLKITKEHQGLSIKEFLKSNNIGRGKVEEIRVNKSSFINDEYKPLEYLLNEGDILTIFFKEEIDFNKEEKDIDVIYEDDYLLAVNKPSNIIIHPDDKSKIGTLVNRVANYYKVNGINRRVRYIHRLDKDTTGVVLFAKDFFTEAILLKAIEENKIERKYIGYTSNHLLKEKGLIDKPIGQDRHIKNKMCISKTGKPSKTEYELIKRYKDYDEVMFTLLTGRTHQIRVHSSSINCPLLGDIVYGHSSKYISRCALHCYSLKFIHPMTYEEVTIKADIPNDLRKIEAITYSNL